MAERLQIEVTIAPDGAVHLVTHGLKGAECTQETAQLEKAVGKVLRREKTREAYEKVSAGAAVKTAK